MEDLFIEIFSRVMCFLMGAGCAFSISSVATHFNIRVSVLWGLSVGLLMLALGDCLSNYLDCGEFLPSFHIKRKKK